jgi:CheY-like chemotaxis protein
MEERERFLISNSEDVIMKSVMIVDDETAMREVLKIMLRGYKVIEASNGREAIELYKKEMPDIVLMDIIMPIMGGIETIKEIKKINPKAKIVAITAYASSKGEKAIEAGVDYILRKPFSRKEVIKVIEEMTKT